MSIPRVLQTCALLLCWIMVCAADGSQLVGTWKGSNGLNTFALRADGSIVEITSGWSLTLTGSVVVLNTVYGQVNGQLIGSVIYWDNGTTWTKQAANILANHLVGMWMGSNGLMNFTQRPDGSLVESTSGWTLTMTVVTVALNASGNTSTGTFNGTAIAWPNSTAWTKQGLDVIANQLVGTWIGSNGLMTFTMRPDGTLIQASSNWTLRAWGTGVMLFAGFDAFTGVYNGTTIVWDDTSSWTKQAASPIPSPSPLLGTCSARKAVRDANSTLGRVQACHTASLRLLLQSLGCQQDPGCSMYSCPAKLPVDVLASLNTSCTGL